MVSHGVALTLFFSDKTLKRFFEKIKIQDMMDIIPRAKSKRFNVTPHPILSHGGERRERR
jgi:hypothetical protein